MMSKEQTCADRALYKAKYVCNGAWGVGSIINNGFGNNTYLFDPNTGGQNIVDPSTVCQWTGLTDKKGKKIWRGDTLSHEYDGPYWGTVVVWRNGAYYAKLHGGTKATYPLKDWLHMRDVVGMPEYVTGNIHDKEL